MSSVSSSCSSISATPGDQILAEVSKVRQDGPPAQDDATTASAEREREGQPTQADDPSDTLAVNGPEPSVDAPSQDAAAEAPSGIPREGSASTNAQDVSSASPSQTRNEPPAPLQQSEPVNADGSRSLVPHQRAPIPDNMLHTDKMRQKRESIRAKEQALQRSSEATAAAAAAALKHPYQAAKRGQRIWRNSSPPLRPAPPPTMPYPQQHPYHTPQGYSPQYQHPLRPPQQPMYAPPPPPPPPPPRGPPCDRIKAEQARLLTFLRSLHPVLVVDQLCKALAYFGGIPNAPPPADYASFPQSDKDNGSGALMVAWLSEIFPPADPNKSTYANLNGLAGPVGGDSGLGGNNSTNAPSYEGPRWQAKRLRGRPKGSKSSKPRKDKGIKKGPKTLNGNQEEAAAAPEVLVVEDDNPDSDSVSDSDDQQEPSSSKPRPSSNTQVEQAQAPAQPQPSATANPTTPSSRKRGRPKGSKNRPKPVTVDLTNATTDSNASVSGSQESPTMTIARTAAQDATRQRQPTLPTSQPAHDGALSQHVQYWADPPPQSSGSGNRADPSEPADASRKRKTHRDAPGNTSTPQLGQETESSNHPNTAAPQGTQAKRRRVPQAVGAQQPQATNLYSQSSGEVPASPSLPNPGANSGANSQSPQNAAPFPRPGSVQQQQPSPQQARFGPSAMSQQQQQQKPRPTQARDFYQQHSQQHQPPARMASSPGMGAASNSYGDGNNNNYLSMQYSMSASQVARQPSGSSAFSNGQSYGPGGARHG